MELFKLQNVSNIRNQQKQQTVEKSFQQKFKNYFKHVHNPDQVRHENLPSPHTARPITEQNHTSTSGVHAAESRKVPNRKRKMDTVPGSDSETFEDQHLKKKTKNLSNVTNLKNIFEAAASTEVAVKPGLRPSHYRKF